MFYERNSECPADSCAPVDSVVQFNSPLIRVRMMNAALRLAELHINMIYEQHSTHLETCAYIVVITFLRAHVVDKLTSTVHDIV